MDKVTYVPTPFSYSAAVKAGDYVFLGLHRGFGDDFTTQFDDTFSRLGKTLAEFQLSVQDIVKVNVWLKNIQDLPEMEKRFNNYFDVNRFPARMTSTTEFINNDCLLMIEGIAYTRE
ncbi:MAG: RidA family protein [Dehalococcoidales bacterium]|nr:RidA family protein [Dehalococcoidales bacterium]